MNIIKQEIKEKTHKLNAKWTFELDKAQVPNIAKEALNDLSKTIQEEIDWEIMCEMLKKFGYSKVEMKWPDRINEVQAHMIKEWCRANLKGHYQGRSNIWMFEKEQDAVLFSLRWS